MTIPELANIEIRQYSPGLWSVWEAGGSRDWYVRIEGGQFALLSSLAGQALEPFIPATEGVALHGALAQLLRHLFDLA